MSDLKSAIARFGAEADEPDPLTSSGLFKDVEFYPDHQPEAAEESDSEDEVE